MSQVTLRPRQERLLWVIVILDTILAGMLVPLLPHYFRAAHLSTLGAGVLTGAFAAGVLAGTAPGAAIMARSDARVTLTTGLVSAAAASVVFGLATSAPVLVGARLIQGIGSGMVWTGSLAWLVGNSATSRRGEAIGRTLGAAVLGQLLGPACGALGVLWGTPTIFSVIACANLLLAVLVMRSHLGRGARAASLSWRAVASSLHDRRVGGAVWLIAFPAVLAGTLAVVAPLRLAALGTGAAMIAAMWLASGSVEALLSTRIGRGCDRRGVAPLLRAALLVSACACLLVPFLTQRWALIPAVVVGATAFGCLWVPAMTHLTHVADAVRLEPEVGFALQSAWAPGHVFGTSVLGGGLTQLTGPAGPLLILFVLCGVTFLGAGRLTAQPS